MALSSKSNQYKTIRNVSGSRLDCVSKAALWSESNLLVGRYSKEHFGKRYIMIGFEDICDNPQLEIERLLQFAGLEGNVPELAKLVLKPASVGRYRSMPTVEIEAISSAAEQGLRHFEYV